MLNLFINRYIQNMLEKVEYEYDEDTKSWGAILKELPGAYAQADTVEEVRQQMAEVIEDYIIVSLKERQKLPSFKRNPKVRVSYA